MTSLMFNCSPFANRTVAPYQKNWVARVAMMEGTPTLATSMPLIYPTNAPQTRAKTKPAQGAQGVWNVLKTQANTNPESATTAGKLKSISPAVMTRVRPNAQTSTGGTVCRNDM